MPPNTGEHGEIVDEVEGIRTRRRPHLGRRAVRISRIRGEIAVLNGDMESRTPDILLAKQALYQLSYVP